MDKIDKMSALLLVLMWLIAMLYTLAIMQGCSIVDLRVEVQATNRTNSAASRNPIVSGTEVQGSERIQNNPENRSKTVELPTIGTDVTGAEK